MKTWIKWQGFDNTTWGWLGLLSGAVVVAIFVVAALMWAIELSIWAWKYVQGGIGLS